MNHRTPLIRPFAGLACALAAAGLALSVAPAALAAPLADAGAASGPARIVPGSLVRAGGMAVVKSTNWGGYADLSTNGSTYTKVSANWTLPTLKCNSTTAGGFASFWVGLDGFNDNTVEQNGTRAICVNSTTAQYVDWWEMYPGGVNLVHSTLKAGDKITGSVIVSGTTYKLSITDHTHPSDSFSVTQTCAKTTCKDASAEWITEAHVTNGIPFPDYGTEAFTNASVTSGTKTGTISSFSHDAIITVDSSGNVVASVSKLTNGGTTFRSIWHRSS